LELTDAGTAHRDAVCRMFRDTFNPYRPAVIDRPQLAPDALACSGPTRAIML
jgi:hypothetical protein